MKKINIFASLVFILALATLLIVSANASFLDPNSTILDGWGGTGDSGYTQIVDTARQPSVPSTGTYVSIARNEEGESQFGFPEIEAEAVANVTLWVYTATGSNVGYTFELRQGGSVVCSTTLGASVGNSWQSCTWNEPTGSLDDLSIFLSNPTNEGGGKPTEAFVYAAYIEYYEISAPEVSLVSPADDVVVEDSPVNFSFSVSDDTFSVMDSCSLYGNFSGSWDVVDTINDVDTDVTYTFSESVGDGVYEWNVECDNGVLSAFAEDNRTVTVNAVPPLFENAALNETLIRQNRSVLFTVDITDVFGISFASVDLEFPDSSVETYVLDNAGDEYFFVFSDTIEEGTYSVVDVFANDTLGQSNTINPGLSFEVQAIPPEPFSLLNPANNTETTNTTPNLEWEETSTPDFKNYTVQISTDSGFSSIAFEYYLTSITETNIQTDPLDTDQTYYWRVIAYDVFENSRFSNQEYVYITDNTAPEVLLINPPNSSFVNNIFVEFEYVPNDINTLDECILYTDTFGSWAPVNSTINPVKNEVNVLSTTLDEGPNVWNVQCFDLAENEAFATENFTVVVDTTGPVVTLLDPINNAEFNDSNVIEFTAVAFDDLASVDSCSLLINGSVVSSKGVDDNVPFSFNRFLINGLYEWSVSCVDVNGNSDVSESRLVLVNNSADVAPNVVLNSPSNDSYLMDDEILFNYTVEDTFGVDFCELYIDDVLEDTDNDPVNLDSNTFFVSGFSEDSYEWRVECVDSTPSTNRGFSENFTFAVDLTDPVVSLESPLDNAEFSDSNVLFEYIPVDDNLDFCELFTDDNGGFQSRLIDTDVVSGVVNSFSYEVLDGVSVWNVECFDLSGRSSFAEFNRTITVDTTPPKYFNITTNPESPAVFNYTNYYFNITWIDNIEIDTVIFESNFSGIKENITVSGQENYSVVLQNLTPGNYTYRWYANDTLGNENSTDEFNYVIEKAEPLLRLFLDGMEENITINESSEVNITAIIERPQNGLIELSINNIIITENESEIQVDYLFQNPGFYNVTIAFEENQNYTSKNKTLAVEALDITPPVINLIRPSNDTLTSTNVLFEFTVNDFSDVDECSLFIDNSLNETIEDVEKQSSNSFSKTLEEGVYEWRVECTDEFENTGVSETRIFEVIDLDELFVNISTDKETYETGEEIIINASVFDAFNNPVTSWVDISVVDVNTSYPWWNFNWSNRRQLTITETTGEDIENGLVNINVTNINLQSCEDELRVVNKENNLLKEMPKHVYDTGGSWCLIGFEINLTNSEERRDYFIYYNNSEAPSDALALDVITSQNFYAGDSAADEGTPTNVVNIIGFNDDTSATLNQGGGGGTHSAHGTNFVDEVLGNIISVEARFRYHVTSDSSMTWQLRYSTDSGGNYETAFSGATTTVKTTSPWVDITSDYSVLDSESVNDTRLQARIVKTGGGPSATMEYFWAELNVTYERVTEVEQVVIGDEESLIQNSSGDTNSQGTYVFTWVDTNIIPNNYSIIAWASREGYSPASNYTSIELIIDETPPNVTLVTPENDSRLEKGFVNFSFITFDINLNTCTLYLGQESLEENQTIIPINNEENFFDPIELDYGNYTWNVLCNDTYSNEAFAEENFTFQIIIPTPLNFTARLLENRTFELNWEGLGEGETYNIFFSNDLNQGFDETPDMTGYTQTAFSEDVSEENKRFYKVTTVVQGGESEPEIAGIYEINLEEGFNMISIPFELENYELYDGAEGFIFNTDEECLLSVWNYNADTEEFKRTDWINNQFIPSTGSEDFTSLNKKEGYWLETNSACSLMTGGVLEKENIEINLYENYNLIPWYSGFEVNLPTDFETPIINTTPSNAIVAINRFNNTNQEFEVTIHYIVGGEAWGWWPSFNNQHFTRLRPLEGYYFNANQEALWRHEPLQNEIN